MTKTRTMINRIAVPEVLDVLREAEQLPATVGHAVELCRRYEVKR